MQATIPGKGTLQGTTILDPATKEPKCHRFSRIPYACPPIGHRRWRKPEPLPLSFSYGFETDPGQYTRPCSVCPQPAMPGIQSSGSDEDCLQLNIHVPLGQPPHCGWPVFFYIHGGFLQFASNTLENPEDLLRETDVKCVVVQPNYRLGLFGFLASTEIWESGTSGSNFGFWDQRQALEWTYENIEFFGGNKENITAGGLSAGSYSTFHQLAYDLSQKSERQIIRRVIQWSNGCGVQPKPIEEAQQQFDDLVSVLRIPASLSDDQKLEALRGKSAAELVAAVGSLKQKFFRPILDGNFISEDLFQNLYNGKFGQRMKDLGIQTIIGDLTQEWQVYKMVYPPDSYEALVDRVSWDYPRAIAVVVCEPHRSAQEANWVEIFGKLYADLQVHSTMRGFLQCIYPAVPLSDIYRYTIDWRAQSIDKTMPQEAGATHGTDLAIWMFGNGDTLTVPEKELIREWLRPMGQFLRGEEVFWGTKSITEVRYLTAEGKIEIKEDESWERKLSLWNSIKQATLSQAIV